MNASIDVLTLFLFNIVLVNIPLLYGTVGEIVTEKAGSLNLGVHQFRRERRYAILQFRQLVGDIEWQQVAARGQHLAELDENRPQRFKRLAQAFATRCFAMTTEAQQT